MIYAVGDIERRVVKVGYSTKPENRIKAIKTSYPHELEVVALFEGSAKQEKAIHRAFTDDRLSGEWFRLTPRLLAHLAKRAQINPLTWGGLCRLQPRLIDLYGEVHAIQDDGSSPFCANAVWTHVIKWRLSSLTGWSSKAQHRLVQTSLAYDLAGDWLYQGLPPCRDCDCL